MIKSEKKGENRGKQHYAMQLDVLTHDIFMHPLQIKTDRQKPSQVVNWNDMETKTQCLFISSKKLASAVYLWH